MNLLTKIARVLWIGEYRQAFLRARVAASTEHDSILADLAIDTVVDIGANRGQFALCARRLFPGAMIYSFEPLSGPAATYRRLFKGDPSAVLYNTAISTQSGTADMHVSRWDVSSSLLPIGQLQNDNFVFSTESRRETVSTDRLATCLEESAIVDAALLKVDVQGFELVTLRGCEERLQLFRYVYVEASFVELYVGQALASDVCRFLLSMGFDLVCVANLSYGRSSKPVQADFLFARTGAAARPPRH